MLNELRDILSNSERYKSFTMLSEPKPFNELFKDKNFDCVQLHSTQIYECGDKKNIVGFCGTFSWKDNFLESLDMDAYSESVEVIGYEYFNNENAGIKKGVEILVEEEW